MRGFGHTLSRLPKARAFFAGAAILAGASFGAPVAAQNSGGGQAESGRSDETAMAVTRLAPRSGGGLTLPRPMDSEQAARVRRIFALLGRGSLSEAGRETAALTDPLLIGHIQAERLLGRHHRASAVELITWLDEHGTLPDAPAIHALLLRRLPKGAIAPPEPLTDAVSLAHLPKAPPEELDETLRDIPRNPVLDRGVAKEGEDGDRAGALRLIARAPVDAAYGAVLRAELAQSLFAQNRDKEALEVAGNAFRRGAAAGKLGYAGYIAGLAAWRLDRPQLARGFFEDAARAPLAPPAVRAAASYWAARANTRTSNPRGFTPWLRRAAEHKRTFYGLLAQRALGQDFGLSWARETLGEADLAAIAANPRGKRLFGLLQIGETRRAEAELRHLWAETRDDPGFLRALLLVAREADMIDLTTQLATLLQAADGRAHDEARFSLPKLEPRGGFSVDPALVYALTRLESNFDANAVSPAGARGLMQLMPLTASYIAGDRGFSEDRLSDPAINLELGQRYVLYLAQHEMIGENLLRILAAYNSGPGSFQRWYANLRDDGDPLLFIEAIPKMETRLFVQRALAYSWIYAARMHRGSSSLDDLSAGAFPRFTPRPTRVASNSLLH